MIMSANEFASPKDIATAIVEMQIAFHCELSKLQVTVYQKSLMGLTRVELRYATERALVEHRYKNIPSVAELRTWAAELKPVGKTHAEAMEEARLVIRRYGGIYNKEACLAAMSPETAAMVNGVGFEAFCNSEAPEILNAQCRMAFEAAQERRDTKDRLPAHLQPGIGANEFVRLSQQVAARLTAEPNEPQRIASEDRS